MKFSLKLLLWTMIVMAVALGFSGFYFVNYVFSTSMERETSQAIDENSILRFAFETAVLNVPVKYDILQDHTVEQVASKLEGSQEAGRLLRLSDEQKNILYASDGFDVDEELLLQTGESVKAYRIINSGGRYYVHTGSAVNALDRVLYLETLKDVSGVFHERDMGFRVYQRMTMLMLVAGVVIMHIISSWLTKPIKLLTKATRRMESGDYSYRAKRVSNDELGQLTMDFNRMAAALEENISMLEEEIQAREDFVGAFAHELKTPLTSIIGYADMLRSRKLDEEKSFISANYIYTEGKRLEAMSLRLLDIIVTRRGEAKFQRVAVEGIFEYLRDTFSEKTEYEFEYAYDDGAVWAEADLIKTVLVNLLDNACKASETGGRIEVTGQSYEGYYYFTVRDYGVGIPQEEQAKITQAFYMVDKSRSRSRNGAGLGLALCAEILALHGAALDIESELGKGTSMSFALELMGMEEGEAYGQGEDGQPDENGQGGEDEKEHE